MNRRAFIWIALLAAMPCLSTCSKSAAPVSGEVPEQLAEIQREKAVIEEKMREIEQVREHVGRDLESLRISLESTQRALTRIQSQLDTLRTVPQSSLAKPKRLPLEISIVLLVAAVLSVLAVFKLRSRHPRDTETAIAEGMNDESVEKSKR
jgi:septal ring factor EnvC (AmiA/AmiB activator)